MSQQESNPGNKRRNFYIDKDFQTKFIVKFTFLLVAGAGLTIALLYWLARHSSSVSVTKSRVVVMTTADLILPMLIQTVVVVAIVIGIAAIGVTLFVSHKIAGPLFHFKRIFKEIAGGNFTKQVNLRKDDQFHTVAVEFNEIMTVVRTKMQTTQEQVVSLKALLDAMGALNLDDQKRKQFNDFKAKLQELETTVNFFKV
ncbi:MAG: methyl-accepting chemotaxis protein [Candidatus Omnitrophica bacterium]|nr:methyl-accepting chemotaxis protein [Candidatus Omnitrophota bacterium]